METFAPPRQLVDNPRYDLDRERILASLDLESIDAPIREIIAGLAELPCCYTIQSCYGHFVHAAQPEPHNLEPVSTHDTGPVRYRIAYLALCLENSHAGRRLRTALEQIPAIDPEYVQFGSPEWFSRERLNTYALQVEPARFMYKDEAVVERDEALHLQEIRDRFFARLAGVVQAMRHEHGV
ncbi:hypothetical protein ACFL4Y_02990 [Gemmatimonadota bacterium]